MLPTSVKDILYPDDQIRSIDNNTNVCESIVVYVCLRAMETYVYNGLKPLWYTILCF